MIETTEGNLLNAPVEALVNTVNTVGIMGKGIALQFKQRFPANFWAYAQACKLGQVQTGRMFVTEPGELTGPRWVVNFPTKQHWRSPSRMEWVVAGRARGSFTDTRVPSPFSELTRKSPPCSLALRPNTPLSRRRCTWPVLRSRCPCPYWRLR